MADTTRKRTSGNPTVGEKLCETLRAAAACIPGDQVAPCAILWTDPENLWEGVMDDLKSTLPELFMLGAHDVGRRSGPAVWLRCVEGRTIEGKPTLGHTPIFYLPGISKQQLRAIEECPQALQPIAEMQFRGLVWAHPNGKDWTPYAFMTSQHGGLELEVARDGATAQALQRSLPALLKEPVAGLRGNRLDAEFFNHLLAPDLPREILRWMDGPAEAKKLKSHGEWQAFCDQCSRDYKFHPEKDGELRAADLMGHQEGKWAEVWRRFADAPMRYSGVADLLGRASPAGEGKLNFHPESWPTINAQAESDLLKGLLALKDVSGDKAVAQILELEKAHGLRRDWVWHEMGKAPLAGALKSLSLLATLVQRPLAAPSLEEFGELYSKSGWEVDEAVMMSLASPASAEEAEAICAAVRAMYLPWLEESARNLQSLTQAKPDAILPFLAPVEAKDGRVILFVDGLRMDIGRGVAKNLQDGGLAVDFAWDWAPFPTLTATAKPFVSPVRSLLKGGDALEDFSLVIAENGKTLTQDRLTGLLSEKGVSVLAGPIEKTSQKAGWLEAGNLDEHGHNDGWRIARFAEEETVSLAAQIRALLSRGWTEVMVVTDHGWLLMPGGLPKINLPNFLADHRWGRCAAIKASAVVNMASLRWYWNSAVNVAYPPGTGCFKAGKEYAHGGISAQEMIVPRLVVSTGKGATIEARISGLKWVGLRCRVIVSGATPSISVDVRARQAEPASSKIEGGKPREVGPDGTVSLPIGDDKDQGTAAVVVLLSADGRIVHFMPTVIGENS